MIYYHYSAEPLLAVHSIEQLGLRDDKPSGLWISDDTDYGWRKWCEDNDFRIDTLKHRYEIKICGNLLRINSGDELEIFTREYVSSENNWRQKVDWSRIAKAFDGILITPYIYSHRLLDNFYWYYSWDCASGCIWNASAIESIKLMEIAE